MIAGISRNPTKLSRIRFYGKIYFSNPSSPQMNAAEQLSLVVKHHLTYFPIILALILTETCDYLFITYDRRPKLG